MTWSSKDADGYDISADIIEGMKAAKDKARYYLSDEYARRLGTTHEALGTFKAEVQATRTGTCLWDAFR